MRRTLGTLILAVGAVMPAVTATQETNMRAKLDYAYSYQAQGQSYLAMGGWAVANGWTPGKGFYVDGALVGDGISTVERHDVGDIVKGWGWTVDDGQAKSCDISGTWFAPCESCVGLFQIYGPIAPGPHKVAICVSGKSDASFSMPDVVCDSAIVNVQ